ncbi:hypothetical protein F4811DRAFT_534607 [Daldinia bambusicola]|nr:hypothetical protein F4811DRAFT_534607 [Daldinia bambusicola]
MVCCAVLCCVVLVEMGCTPRSCPCLKLAPGVERYRFSEDKADYQIRDWVKRSLTDMRYLKDRHYSYATCPGCM